MQQPQTEQNKKNTCTFVIRFGLTRLYFFHLHFFGLLKVAMTTWEGSEQTELLSLPFSHLNVILVLGSWQTPLFNNSLQSKTLCIFYVLNGKFELFEKKSL